MTRKHHRYHSDVYDCVNRQVDLPLISFTGERLADLSFKCGQNKIYETICDFLDCEKMEEYTTQCFISNKWGRPLTLHKAHACGALLCKEMEQAYGRRDVQVSLPNGKTANLQVVKVLVKGYVGVHILDATGNVICTTCEGIPFATVQTFYLCAPEGTYVDCMVTFLECDGTLLCSNEFRQLDLSISLCLEVRMVGYGCGCYCSCEKCCHCHPRKELDIVTTCPDRKFPPHCPQIFPSHGS